VCRECEEEETGTSDITHFFGGVGEKRMRRCPYFKSKKMKHVLISDLKSALE